MINLEKEIIKTNHTREQRSYFANLILKNPELLFQLLTICKKVNEEISCKASWGLEFVSKKQITIILPHLNQFILLLPVVHLDPAVRPIAKICENLILAYYKTKDPSVLKHLTQSHREKITEACFDWLITDQKVAPKAYSITSLYLLGTEFNWIHSELKTILENNYHNNTAAYKARSRMILKKLAL